MANLTPEQREALEWVNTADKRWREAKRSALLEIRRLVQERIDLHAATRDAAVWEAHEKGVPKSRIGREGLGTSSPNAVYEILERVTEKLGSTNVELAQKPTPRYAWSEGTRIPAGVYWWLLVDGDDHEVHNDDADIHGTGYLYVRWNAGDPVWLGGKPDEAALRWADENRPS